MAKQIRLDKKKLLGFRLGSRHAAGSKIGLKTGPVKATRK